MHVVITGAGSGIGQATALRFARDGHRALIVDRDEDGLEQTTRRARDRLEPLVIDVADETAPQAILQACLDRLGPPDALINNAGVGGAQSVHETDDESLDRFLAVNLRSVIRISREFLNHWLDRKHPGLIVNLSSIFGRVGFPTSSTYTATKAAVAGLTRNMAADYGPHGIRVNAVAPGLIETGMTANRIATDSWFLDSTLGGTPLQRVGKPDDIASAIAFLCSEDASFITGHELVVDGGWSATRFRPA